VSPATYQAKELAERLGVSTWAIYESVRQGTCPVEPIRVGKRLVWPRAKVNALLGLNGGAP
jgi:predicted DNA-binding transcriptional regulator AlpA